MKIKAYDGQNAFQGIHTKKRAFKKPNFQKNELQKTNFQKGELQKNEGSEKRTHKRRLSYLGFDICYANHV